MTFTVGGVDFLPYLQAGGLEYTRNAIDGPNAGRAASGTLIRDYLADKLTWKGTCRPLSNAELSTILAALKPEEIPVIYTDPETATDETGMYYCSTVPVTLRITDRTSDRWVGLTFTLVEF